MIFSSHICRTCGHESGFDRSRTPVRVQRFQQCCGTRDMGTRHGSSGDDVVSHCPVVVVVPSQAGYWGPCGQNVHPGTCDVRLLELHNTRGECFLARGEILTTEQLSNVVIREFTLKAQRGRRLRTFRMSGVIVLGPREEKMAVTGTGASLNTVAVFSIRAVGDLQR